MSGIEMDYGEEAELICRMLVDRGATLSHSHYSRDRDYYRHECEGLTFAKIAYHLWQVEDSALHIEYKGVRRWLRFIFGNSFGELVGDYSCSRGQSEPVDYLISSILSGTWSHKSDEYNNAVRVLGEPYFDLRFNEITTLMGGAEIYTRGDEEE